MKSATTTTTTTTTPSIAGTSMATSLADIAGNVGKKTSAAIETISKIEELGEDILTDRHQLVDLDKKRNGNREAINVLKKKDSKSKKSWLCIGNTFFKFEDDMITKALQHDQKELDKEIKSIRHGLTSKVSDLHRLEGQKDIKGFSLASLTADDMTYIKGDGSLSN